jgi:hypothetical protein
MQKIKGHLKNYIEWNVADGSRIAVLSQPWHAEWQQVVITQDSFRNLKVADLIRLDRQ